jgi:hypothetical protein
MDPARPAIGGTGLFGGFEIRQDGFTNQLLRKELRNPRKTLLKPLAGYGYIHRVRIKV